MLVPSTARGANGTPGKSSSDHGDGDGGDGDGGDAIGSEGGRCERSLHPDARGDIGHIVVTKRSTLEFAWSLWDLECFCIRTFSF